MPSDGFTVAGWDVGGVHIKAACVGLRRSETGKPGVVVRPTEIWREREDLSSVLGDIADDLNLRDAKAVAATMTAELSDTFRNKREGVLFVLDAIESTFPRSPIYPLNVFGDFVSLELARAQPLDFAATNWVASSLFVAGRHPDCVLLDVGSTTTDIIPIRGGRVVSEGRTDLTRLASGELVYTGALRTNPNVVARHVPVKGRMCGVAAEHFTVMADVYLLLGRLPPERYTCPTADGRAKSPEAAAQRLARLVCADDEMLDETEILNLARYLYEKQIQQISEALLQILSRLEDGYDHPLAVAGAGSFLAAEVGRRLGLTILELGQEWGETVSVALPAYAAACLLAQRLDEGKL